MSKVYDQDGNVVNRPAPQVAGKYEDAETSLVQDWYIQHPEEIKPVEPSTADLDAVEKEKEVAQATAAPSNDAPTVEPPASTEAPVA